MLAVVLKIALINLLLSRDNVLLIALLSRELGSARRLFALSASLVASIALQLGILFFYEHLERTGRWFFLAGTSQMLLRPLIRIARKLHVGRLAWWLEALE